MKINLDRGNNLELCSGTLQNLEVVQEGSSRKTMKKQLLSRRKPRNVLYLVEKEKRRKCFKNLKVLITVTLLICM